MEQGAATYEVPPDDPTTAFNADVLAFRPIACRVARRKERLFAPWPEIDRDDLVQDALLAALLARRNYDPAKAGDGRRYKRTPAPGKRTIDPRLSSFLYVAGSRQILDRWRSRSRLHAREQAVAVPPRHAPPPGGEDPALDPDDGPGDDLARWTADKLRRCQRVYGTQGHGARYRPACSKAQAAVLVLLMVYLRLRPDELFVLVDERRDLREAMGLGRTPSRAFFRSLARRMPAPPN